ncbi:hypothetical protein GCM10027266_15710 [Arenimonas alkanexedens]
MSDAREFNSTDCFDRPDSLDDCSGIDDTGIKYVVFGSAVSVVSADFNDAADTVSLPFGLVFGETNESAVRKVEKKLSISMDVSTTSSGGVEYSSDFVVTSGAGVPYSIVLVADSSGLLAKYIERTDF